MLESIFLGFLQGVFEWLPVSSEGILILAQKNLFDKSASITELVQMALFLHMGTFLSALVYFRGEVKRLFVALLSYHTAEPDTQKTLVFLVISTLVSGTLGMALLKIFVGLEHGAGLTGRGITLLVGLLLLITGGLQLKSPKSGQRQMSDLGSRDALLLGVVQGLAALPGFSRSGLTVAGLLLRKFDKALSLRLSFLMSLPIVLAGNIILNFSDFSFDLNAFAGLASAFVFGLFTIDILLKVARKINFGYFVISFGLITLLAATLIPVSSAEAADGGAQGVEDRYEIATFAGGCFWCMQPAFDKHYGVVSTVVGYTGGSQINPTYKEISSSKTGHAEAIEVTYDSFKTHYPLLLRTFWQNIDPTTKDRQFSDAGPQYRTAIFYHSEEQRDQALASKGLHEASGRFGGPIVTEIVSAGPFYEAEDYHQKYYQKYPKRYKAYRIGSGREAYLKRLWAK